MGGFVSSIGNAISNTVSGVSNAVSDVGKGVSDVLSSDLGKAAATAAALYYGAPLVAESLGGSSALANLGATDASLGAAGAVNAGLTSATPVAAGTGLIGGVVDWAKANPLTAAGLGLTAATALGSNTPTSTTTTTSIDPQIKAAYLQNLAEARATAAGLAPRQFAPFPEYNLGMVQKYMNPYESQVIQGTLGDIERARQMQIAQEGAQATGARAFGGSRQAVTRSLVDEAALRNATNAIAQLRQQGFTQAQNLGLSQEALRQQYEQQRLDAARNLGLERLNVAQGALSLQPANIGGSQTTPLYRNPTVSGLGGALSGATLGRLIGGDKLGTEYAGYGAGLGGILGLLG
jgi:hypothetical protein